MNKSRLSIALALSLLAGAAYAYEIQTHAKLSEASLDASRLSKDQQLLQDLGLKATDTFLNSQDPNPRTIKELISDGANFEDNLLLGSLLRVRHHFYDPVYDRPLTVLGAAVGERSPDWALEDRTEYAGGLLSAQQDYSLKDAYDYLYKALTLPRADERQKHFGRTFQALGHVIHHIQDMAQPQHVRNDIHPNIGAHKSLYEDYTNRPEVRDALPYGGYGPVIFGTARRFWHSAAVYPRGAAALPSSPTPISCRPAPYG